MIKQILITIIIFIAIYIIYYLINKRQKLKEEGFTISKSNNTLSINSVSSSIVNMPLIEYCFKASYNSAFDGKNITLLALDNVLSRGCRFLDFEIYSVDGNPVVSYSIDPTFSTLTSGNYLILSKVFNEIIGNCFIGNVPNPRDPLFIHLRINTNCSITNATACDIYQQVASVIEQTLLPKLYVDNNNMAIPIDGSTLLSDICGKIIIVMDASINRDYKNYAMCKTKEKCYNLENYINIETGGTIWKTQKYSDFLNQQTNPLSVDSSNPMMAEPKNGVLSLNLVIPDIGKNVQNPVSPNSFIRDYGCQTILYKFYNNNGSLNLYENLFNQYNTACCPIGYAIQYILKDNENNA